MDVNLKDSNDNQQKNFLDFLVARQKYLLPLLAVVLLLIPLMINALLDKPVVYGYESYYHLDQAKNLNWKNLYYFPLYILEKILPENLLPLISVALGLIFIFLIRKIAEKINIKNKFIFFFTFFLICAPSFIYSFSTITAYSYFLFLYSLVIYLVLQEKNLCNYLAIIPLLFSTTVDIFSNIILISTLLLIYHKRKSRASLILAVLAVFFLLLNLFLFSLPLVLGPFHAENKLVSLVSDFGSMAGMSFFLVMLSIIGLFTTWKKKEYYFAYLFIVFILISYLFSSKIILPLSFIMVFFAVIGFFKLEERKWNREIIKKATIFLLILGLIFSLLSYFERIKEIPPDKAEKETLLWIGENFSPERVVFSLPENSYLIEYFSGLNSFYSTQEHDKNKEEISQKIMESAYVDDLFPLLEENNISIIYFDKQMKSQLPEKYGLRFLLKNERINLVYQNEENEVWVFQ